MKDSLHQNLVEDCPTPDRFKIIKGDTRIKSQPIKRGHFVHLSPNGENDIPKYGYIENILVGTDNKRYISYYPAQQQSSLANDVDRIPHLPNNIITKAKRDDMLFIVHEDSFKYRLSLYDWSDGWYMLVHHDYFY